MVLQGPHQAAQKSVTTMREDWRIWVKWWGEVMVIIWDIAWRVGCVRRYSDNRMGTVMRCSMC